MSGNETRECWRPGEQLVARYKFAGASVDDLPFERGDSLTVLATTGDPNWYRARAVDGRSGLVPANYLHERAAVKLSTMPWFHGKITRELAEQLLTQPQQQQPEQPSSPQEGWFLVRESTNYPGDYTLCVRSPLATVEHYRISCRQQQMSIDDEVFFDSLANLVEHYKNDADGLCCQLTTSVPKHGRHDTVSVDPMAFKAAGWMLSKADVQLGETIGRGEFGEVRVGQYGGERVAVKSLRDCDRAVEQFLAEASVMTALRHANLVQLIGVVYEDNVVYQVMEYMAQGNLVNYLRTRGRLVITKHELISFACDTCAGMAYLESRRVVHRDLAARNVLISQSGVAKVSDFGLAREQRFNREGGKIPVKWTAPEAIKGAACCNKSDMWSFGVLLWEIYSFGRGPYPRIAIDDVVRYVNGGYRMEAPDNCPPEIYQLMREAWDVDPDNRPTFCTAEKRLTAFKQHLSQES